MSKITYANKSNGDQVSATEFNQIKTVVNGNDDTLSSIKEISELTTQGNSGQATYDDETKTLNIPVYGSTPLATDEQIFNSAFTDMWGDSLAVPVAYTISQISEYKMYDGAIGGEDSTQIKNRFLARPNGFQHNQIWWFGTNNSENQQEVDTVMADMAEMVETIGHNRFLILSVFNGEGEGIGSAKYSFVMQLNNRLAETYPDNYYNLRTEFINGAFEWAGITPTQEDLAEIASDTVPTSLRSDVIHIKPQFDPYLAQLIQAKTDVFRTEANALPMDAVQTVLKDQYGIYATPKRNGEYAAGGVLLKPLDVAKFDNDEISALLIDANELSNGGKNNVKFYALTIRGANSIIRFTQNFSLNLGYTTILNASNTDTNINGYQESSSIFFRKGNSYDVWGIFFGNTGNFLVQREGSTIEIPASRFTVNAPDQGSIPYPRMTTTQRDAIQFTLVKGLTIFNTTTNKLNIYNGTIWEQPVMEPA